MSEAACGGTRAQRAALERALQPESYNLLIMTQFRNAPMERAGHSRKGCGTALCGRLQGGAVVVDKDGELPVEVKDE